jgi:hypothetical protein
MAVCVAPVFAVDPVLAVVLAVCVAPLFAVEPVFVLVLAVCVAPVYAVEPVFATTVEALLCWLRPLCAEPALLAVLAV